MADLLIVSFNNGDDAFLAVGKDRDNLRVWLIDGHYLKETLSRFPGCLRFMPYADIGKWRTGDWHDLVSRYTIIRLRPDE